MSAPTNNLIKRAIEVQRGASDPASSVWVSASAGTGKTKVLTDRVLSLLVTGNDPQKIICLTFTRAAAAEMEDRIIKRLGTWSTLEEKYLRLELSNLLGKGPRKDQVLRARQLFSIVLESPGGMNIETIHAFCQSLLRRFPLEADIPPHFNLMDERDANELLVQAREEVLSLANKGTNLTLSNALSVISRHTHEASIPKLLSSLTSARGRLQRLIHRHGDLTRTLLCVRRLLKVGEKETPGSIISSFKNSQNNYASSLKNAVDKLSSGSNSDIERSLKIKQWLESETNLLENFELYADAFLTTNRHNGPIEIRKTLITKKVSNIDPNLKNFLQKEAGRLVKIIHRVRSATISETTKALFLLSDALLTSYQAQIERRALVDYDDLILEAGNLLNSKDLASWVLFKLDGGIDHVLIDEAQDTSPEQWRVIKSLVSEFTSGLGAHEKEPTVFAVGDLKQSIYSFQGADPKEFQAIKSSFGDKFPKAGHNWREVNLTVSFRSTPAILHTVDAVFRADNANDGVILDGKEIKHDAARVGDGGLVELWPPVEPRELDTPIPWKPPIERIQGDSPSARLANLISKRIHKMINEGEVLVSKGRAIEAGDIMVLVRQRGTFVEELVRALKSLDIGVSGSDRMVLTEQISVMDLISLGQFLLLPEDDLTLAIVLKSPFIGFSEENLFDLAYNRSSSLWQELKIRRKENKIFETAYELLSVMLSKVDSLAPFELYKYLLNAKGGLKNILARLGPDAADPVSEFLNLALSYENNHTPSLEGFLYWIKSGDVEIKRDLEQSRPDAVRIMTVHGAKGLQAPIVILPDTMQVPTNLPPFLWPQDEDGHDVGFFWPPKRSLYDEMAEKEREIAIQKRDQEYRRLLYVAMTRAQDRLYICGWNTKKNASKNCWYNLVEKAISKLGVEVEDPLLVSSKEKLGNKVIRVITPQDHTIKIIPSAKNTLSSKLDTWAITPPNLDTLSGVTLIPSRINNTELDVYSPLSDKKGRRFIRGNIIHKLLQILPELEPKFRKKAARKYLALDTHKLNRQEQTEIIDETLSVLNHKDFHTLFGLSSKAEVALVGNVNGKVISAQVDRLVVESDRVIIVDYKTNRTPPKEASDVPELYLRQMSAYKLALQKLYPSQKIECLLLWTQGPSLMHLQNKHLAAYSP